MYTQELKLFLLSRSFFFVSITNDKLIQAIARKFSQEGYPLLLLVRKKAKIEELALQNAIIKEIDITNPIIVGNTINNAELAFGPTQLFISHPGIMLLDSLMDQSPNEWEEMISINVISVLNGIKAILQPMIERKNGTIINIIA